MKKLMFILLVLVFAAVLSFGLVSAQDEDRAGWPETFIIGVYPGDNIEEALAEQEPLRVYLEETLGVRTVIITGTSYNAVIEAMRAGRADAFEVGPFSYTLAHEVANAEAIAVRNYSTTVDLEAIPGYYSVLITQKGSGITSIEEMEGKTFAFTDPASTSGYLIPATDLMTTLGFDNKDQIEDYFGELVFAGNHPSSVMNVANGTVDAGATFDDQLALSATNDGIIICGVPAGTEEGEAIFHFAMTQEEIMAIYDECPEGNVAVFHQSPLIPQTPFAVSSNLPQSFQDAVKAALLDIANHEDVLEAFGSYYVDPTAIDPNLESIDSLYDGLRTTAELLDIDLTAS